MTDELRLMVNELLALLKGGEWGQYIKVTVTCFIWTEARIIVI